MNHGVGAFRAFAWGLRKYAWLVALFVLAVGVLVPAVQARSADVYEASALIAPARLTALNIDMVPRYGDRVFENGQVANDVRRALDLSDPEADVTPTRVELISEQDNPSFTVIGRAEDPKEAVRLADIAAATFIQEMNSVTVKSVGRFEIQSSADRPGEPVPGLPGGPFAIALGALAGLLAGIGVVGLILLVRRPVLDGAALTEVTRTKALGKVTLPRSRSDIDVSAVAGIAPLARRLIASDARMILLVSPDGAAAQRSQLVHGLASVLGRARTVRLVQGGHAPSAERSGHEELLLVDGPTAEELAARPATALVVLVVPEGISESSLHRSAENHLDGEGKAGVVLVSRGHRWRRTKRATRNAGAGSPTIARTGDPARQQEPTFFFDADPETDERPSGTTSSLDATSRSGASAPRY